MGAWGAGAFENDTARDFCRFITAGGGPAALRDAFDHVLEAGDEDLEAPTAEEAVAAAAIVARLRDGIPLGAEIEAWIAREQPAAAELAAAARAALTRVMTAPSELLDLWQETEDFPGFQAGLDALLERLG